MTALCQHFVSEGPVVGQDLDRPCRREDLTRSIVKGLTKLYTSPTTEIRVHLLYLGLKRGLEED